MKYFEIMLAWRYLFNWRSFYSLPILLSFLSITIGVILLIIVISIMSGFRQELMDKILGLDSHITVFGNANNIKNFQQLTKKISNLDGVVDVTATVNGQVSLVNFITNKSKAVFVRGVYENSYYYDLFKKYNLYGDLNKNSIAIGYILASRLNLNIGDRIELVSIDHSYKQSIKPNIKSYKVSAIFKFGLQDYDESLIYMPIKDAQKYFKTGNTVTNIDIIANDPEDIDLLFNNIKKLTKYEVYDWRSFNGYFFDTLKQEQNVVIIIMLFVILVACFNITSSLTMIIKDKSSEIAIISTMGASKLSIMRIFVFIGCFLGSVGASIGIVVSVLFLSYINSLIFFVEQLLKIDLNIMQAYSLTKIPINLDIISIIFIFFGIVFMAFISALYPSYYAAKIPPTQILNRI